MFDIIKKIWQVGTVTEKQPFKPAAKNYKGKIKLTDVAGTNWDECIAACPTKALSRKDDTVTLFQGGCIFCGRCAAACKTAAVVQTNECYLAAFDKADLYEQLELKEGK